MAAHDAPLRLSALQADAIMSGLERSASPRAHRDVWSRRRYAPMHIHRPEFADVRDALEARFPRYAVAFDVVFESRGASVEWHTDYESLGPFSVPDRWEAVRDGHFLTVHFNLTPSGGRLVTLPWPVLSYVFYVAILWTGIFGWAHRLLVWLCAPLLGIAATVHPNAPLSGNVFDNTRLHMVTSGAPRVSYVVRMVRRGRVSVSRASVVAGLERSDACLAFVPLLAWVYERPRDAASLPWDRMGEEAVKEVEREGPRLPGAPSDG